MRTRTAHKAPERNPSRLTLALALITAGASGCGDATPTPDAPTNAAESSPAWNEPAATSAAPNTPAATASAPEDAPLTLTMLSVLPPGSASASAAPHGTVSNAGEVVATFAPEFRRCYNDALARDRESSGTLRVTAKVGPQGEVVSATATRTGRLDDAIAECCSTVVQKGKFAPPDTGGATLVIPVTFQPQS